MNKKINFPASNPIRSLLPYETHPPRRILVAEDNRAIRQLNSRILTDSGYEVDAAENGEVAWDSLQLNSYDLLITDNNMPKLSGVDLLQKLFAASMALPVIMMTGITPTEELARQHWLQIEAMLLKPCPIDELLATVRNVLLANHGTRYGAALPSIWQSQPSAFGLRAW
jgi:DNA-binding response OmpR family regulator